jgi:hypothetical protein
MFIRHGEMIVNSFYKTGPEALLVEIWNVLVQAATIRIISYRFNYYYGAKNSR